VEGDDENGWGFEVLRRDLGLVKIKTYMLLTAATISMNCTALFCLIVTQWGAS
jgi:hypothetical protein